jgi:hypothetical protein
MEKIVSREKTCSASVYGVRPIIAHGGKICDMKCILKQNGRKITNFPAKIATILLVNKIRSGF